MIQKLLTDIENSKEDNTIYLLEKLSDTSGFFVLNKKLMYMEMNLENLSHESINTEFLSLDTNVSIHSIENNNQFDSGYYNVLTYRDSTNTINFEAFVSLCSSYAKNSSEILFNKFFYSLISLFQLPKEQQLKNMYGLYGELKFIEYIYRELNIDISPFWHTGGSNDKYDFVFSKSNFEVKTITSEELLIKLKHAQIFNSDHNYLVVVSTEHNNSGETLTELIQKLQNAKDFCNGYNFNLNIEKEKRRISLAEASSIRLKLLDVLLYETKKLNVFEDIPEEISDLSYKYNLSTIQTDNFESRL
ncbi:MAG: PD-(D/E)XK motif protein, partial [Clostridiaceae bacterium]